MLGAASFTPVTLCVGHVLCCCLLQVMSVIPFDSDAEAVAIANDCPFGLGSSVFSGSVRRARAIAAQLEAGGS